MIAQDPIQASIWFSMNHYAHQDAIFLAERLFAEVASEDALYLLATCYYQSGKANAAYSILGSHEYKSAQCRFLFARSCFDLKKFCEAEEALIGHLKGTFNTSGSSANSKNNLRALDMKLKESSISGGPQAISTDVLIKEYGESAAFAAQLMGLICIKTCRNHLACEYLQKSLEMNPFLFRSFELLIELGAKVNPSKVFSLDRYPDTAPLEPFSLIHGSNPLLKLWNSMNKPNFEITAPTSTPMGVNMTSNQLITGNPCYFTPPNMPNYPSVHQSKPSTLIPSNITPVGQSVPPVNSPKIPPRRSARINTGSVKENTKSTLSRTSKPIASSRTSNYNENKNNKPAAPKKTRRSSTNTTSSTISSTDNKKESEMNEINRQMPKQLPVGNGGNILKHVAETQPKINQRSSKSEQDDSLKEASDSASSPEKPASVESALTSSTQTPSTPQPINLEALIQSAIYKQRDSAEGLLQLLAHFGRAWSLLGQFHCPKAIDELNKIEYKQRQTGWVLVAMGRAYFEMGRYEEACKCFERVRQLEPHRLQGMEYYSTALWHLQREKQLSTLAQDMIEFDKTASQTWCAAGNCFSLQKEHETAIKFLHRAIQVDPDHAYAYTLLGHELVLTEEMEQAMAAFRSAMRLDQRHYNAWYGLGMIYYKQEKYTLAEMHYMKALKINPYSPVLMCHLGVVRHALKKSDLALQTLDAALQMDKRNALCKFHRASIYFALDKHQKALKELEELKQIVPKESLVYFLIGKVHKKMGNTHLALMNFSWAMDLDPKGANNQIKEVIDKQYAGDDEESICVLPDTAVDSSANISDALDVHNDDEDEESNEAEDGDIGEMLQAFNDPPILSQDDAMQHDDDDSFTPRLSHSISGQHESVRSVDMSEELPDQSIHRIGDSNTSVEESFSLPALDVHMDDSGDVSNMIGGGLGHSQPESALDILHSDTSDVISIDNDGHNHHGSIPSPSL